MTELTALSDTFRNKATMLLDILKSKGIDYTITSTRRDINKQRELYDKGLTPVLEDSKHLKGDAIDINIVNSKQRFDAAQMASGFGFNVITYSDPRQEYLIHIDDKFKTAFNKLKKLHPLYGIAIGGLIAWILRRFLGN